MMEVDDILFDEQEEARELQFIREQIADETADRLSDELLQWIVAAVANYYVSSGIFEGDDDDFTVDLDEAARNVCQQAAQEGLKLQLDDVRQVVEADLDYMDQDAD